MSRGAKDGVSLVRLGAVACVACCAAPIVVLLGGLGVASLASAWFIGVGGLVVAAALAAAFFAARQRAQSACASSPVESTPVALTTRADR